MNWIPREVIRPEPVTLRQHQEALVVNTAMALWRRRWLIGGLIALGTILGIWYVQNLESKYTAETVVQVDFANEVPVTTSGSSTGALLDARAVIESDARIIGSLSTARRVVTRLDLTRAPEFIPVESKFHRFLASFGLEKLNATPAQLAEIVSLHLLDDLSVSNDRQSYLISIKYTHPNPEKAAKIANAFAAEYLQERGHVSYERAAKNRLWLNSQIASAREALATVENSIVTESGVVDAKARQARMSSLEAEANSIRERLRTLSESLQQARALAELKPASARIAVQATPRTIPSSPNRRIALGVIVGASGALGVLLSLLLERRDTGFRTCREISLATERPCLGEIPGLSSKATAFHKTLLSLAARETAIGLGLYSPTKSHKVVLITSAVPSEGKSYFIKALAESLACSGQRVLVIDASPRSMSTVGGAVPSLEDVLTKPNIRSGLFAGCDAQEIVWIKRSSGIHDDQEAFNSSAFQSFLNQSRDHYDTVLVEAPPVLLLIEGWLISSNPDALLLLARWNKTSQETVKAAIGRIADLSVPMKGVALSRVDLKHRTEYSSADRPQFLKRYYQYYRDVA